MSSRNISDNPPNTAEFIRHRTITLFTTSVARGIFFCPMNMEVIVAPPAAMSVQKATTRFIIGNVIANPAIAIGPTPLPMKMLSMILYNEVATLAMIAGTEYCTNSLLIDLDPSDIGLSIFAINKFYPTKLTSIRQF